MARKGDLQRKLRLGYVVFGVLMVIEIVEYVVGTGLRSGNWPYLGILAIVGAWPILRYFMHIQQLRKPKE
ncbi:MAG: cytochrome C oxidase subunit IV family protein [Chloroflexi bacterium]|nr:cytochrome C oxidase subunit IV family protein [Chloroflexota bacterium]